MGRSAVKTGATTRGARADDPRRFEWLTQVAFVLALALAVARATFTDFSRSTGEPLASEAPRGAGAGTGLALDLLCALPAILVLARRASDRQYVLRAAWSALPLGALAAWAACSTFWAADKFAALTGGMHWIAAAALLWAGAQLVRSWLRLRIVGAVAFGLLLALGAHALFYKAVDVPAQREYWQKHEAEIIKERGWTDDAFAASQFKNKVLAGELIGFYRSANSMAAVAVLLLLVSMGLGAQRVVDDRKDATGAALLLVSAGVAGWLIVEAKSKTAGLTPVLAIAGAAAAWRWRAALAARVRRAYWVGVGVALLAVVAVVGHGLYHHGLPGESLTFRWHYWVGGARLFAAHALAGVGFDNFGLYYLGARLPEAAEEVRDPHNFLVRFAVELGTVGAVLCVAWVGRLAWELVRPVVPPTDAAANERAPQAERPKGDYRGPRAILTLVAIATLALLVNVISSLDFRADAGYVLNELLQKVSMFALLLIGASLAAIKSLAAPELDARPAPLALYGLVAALAAFLVHNLVDFSLFEAGPLTLFALLAGAAVGVRTPSAAGRRKRTAAAAVCLGAACAAWLAVAGFVWAPTSAAEDDADEAGAALRQKRSNDAVRLLVAARDRQPLNADYPFRAANVLLAQGGPAQSQGALELLDQAIRTDPMACEFYLARARYFTRGPGQPLAGTPQVAGHVERDFARAVELNPNDAAVRAEYADALARFGDRAGAVHQYEEALRYDAMLRPQEPKRMKPERVAEIRANIDAMKAS
jgi:O-antigen ligase